MSEWMTLRTFIAVFLSAFGIGMMFVRTEETRMMVGALLLAIGATFLLRVAVELRHR